MIYLIPDLNGQIPKKLYYFSVCNNRFITVSQYSSLIQSIASFTPRLCVLHAMRGL